ncbi:hypothetical protein DPMN_014037 [Dreissena polymorpha]|uniref:Uncharacterized protein n=1 Tax=Dreissena polymorpha TaxID=45954 RepID=A0A9D4N6I7_DREPO|nr:hypothetical protein DPMN_014037 [Dreissena polymorpha]
MAAIGGHFFPLIITILILIRHINKTNVLTKFHDDWPKNVTSSIKTFFDSTVVYRKKNVLTNKCHEDWEKMRLLDCSHKTAPPPGGHVLSLITTIFKLNQDIQKTNILTKFYDDWTKNVTSRVFTSFFYYPHPGGHVFLPIRTIFELNRRI